MSLYCCCCYTFQRHLYRPGWASNVPFLLLLDSRHARSYFMAVFCKVLNSTKKIKNKKSNVANSESSRDLHNRIQQVQNALSSIVEAALPLSFSLCVNLPATDGRWRNQQHVYFLCSLFQQNCVIIGRLPEHTYFGIYWICSSGDIFILHHPLNWVRVPLGISRSFTNKFFKILFLCE